jgi:hypothetical protein
MRLVTASRLEGEDRRANLRGLELITRRIGRSMQVRRGTFG